MAPRDDIDFDHDLASAIWFKIEINEPNGPPRRIMVIEADAILNPLMAGYDEIAVPDLTEAAIQYLEDNREHLDGVTIVQLRKTKI